MAYKTCDDCGNKLYGNRCTWCHEETFIADQYREEGVAVPERIATLEAEQYAAIDRKITI